MSRLLAPFTVGVLAFGAAVGSATAQVTDATYYGQLSYGSSGCTGTYEACYAPPFLAYVNDEGHNVSLTLGTTNFSSTAGANSTYGSVSSALGPAPALAAEGSFFALPVNAENAGFVAHQELSYTFIINGPEAFVPVKIEALGGISGSFNWELEYGHYITAQANILLQIANPNVWSLAQYAQMTYQSGFSAYGYSTINGEDDGFVDIEQSALSANFSGGFVEDGIYMLATNTVHTVFMRNILQGGAAGNPGGGSGYLNAWLDPTFTIDASFVDHDLYSFEFSPGVGNTRAAVPEPRTWALMILGFGAAGAALRRRRPLVA